MATEKLEFVGDATSLEAAYKKLQEENAKLKAGFTDTAKASVKGSKEASAGLDELAKFARQVSQEMRTASERQAEYAGKLKAAHSAGYLSTQDLYRAQDTLRVKAQAAGETSVASASKMLASYLSIGAAISVVNQGLQEQIQLQAKALEVSQSKGNAYQQLAINAGGDMSASDLSKLIAGIEEDVKGGNLSSSRGAIAGAAKAISSVGEANPQLRAAKTRAVLRAIRGIATDESVEDLSQTAAQIGQITGASSEADYRRNLAIGVSAMGVANITDTKGIGFFAKGAQVSLSNAAEGIDKEQALKEAMGFQAALSIASKDRSGEISASSYIDFSKQMRLFGKESGLTGRTDMERLAQIQANPALRAAFIEKGVGGGQLSALFEKALDPNSEFFGDVRAAQGSVTSKDTYLAQLETNMQATREQQNAVSGSRARIIQEQNLATDPNRQRRALIRQLMFGEGGIGMAYSSDAILPNVGGPTSWMRYDVATAVLGYDPEQQAMRQLTERRRDITFDPRHTTDPEAQRQLAVLERIEGLLRQQATAPNSDAARAQIGVNRE